MNYLVFGLGLLLAAAGSASVYAGYDIIQVERGWTEVIAGTTAVSGGIITMSLGIILGRLQSLFRLYAAALPAAAVQRLEAEPLFAAAPIATQPLPSAPFTAPPIAASPPASSIAASSIAASSIAASSNPASPVAASPISASNLFAPPADDNIAAAEAEPRVANPPFSKPSLAKPNFFPAHSREPLKPLSPKLAPLDQADDQVSERLAAGAEAEDTASTPAAPIEASPLEFAVALPPAQPRSASSLSLDEMWKRVSDEIDKPIFTPRPGVTLSLTEETKAAEVPTSQASSASSDGTELPSLAGNAASSTASEAPTALRHPFPLENLDDSRNSLLNEVTDAADATHPGGTQTEESFVSASAKQPAETTPLDDGFGFDDVPANRFDAAWAADNLNHSPQPANEKPIDFSHKPVVPAPSLIGRYEAEGTAYLMFSDGSIEAQSEAGVFHFASMAELKAYIENKQAAEP